MKKKLVALLAFVVALSLRGNTVLASDMDCSLPVYGTECQDFGTSTGDVYTEIVDTFEPDEIPPLLGETISATEAYNRMIALQDDYPEGMPWTNSNTYTSQGYLYRNGYRVSYSGGGCHAFALILSDAVYGDQPIYEHTNFSNIKVGDAIRLNNDSHTVMIIGINGDDITIAEGNYNSSIHWGRKIKRSDSANWNYIISRGDPSESGNDNNSQNNNEDDDEEDDDDSEYTSGWFTYTLDSNGKATITGLSAALNSRFANETFTIPATLDGHAVIAIGDQAFMSTSFGNNSTIVISNGIKTIGKKAFYGSLFGTVKIPASVKAFGIWDYVFSYSHADAIEVDPANTELASVDGVLFTKDLSTLYVYPIDKSGLTYTAPAQTRTLCCTSFGNSSLKRLYLVNPNVTFYTYTFFGCNITVYATQERVDTWESSRTDSWPQGSVTFSVLPDEMDEYIDVTGITLDQTELTIYVGDTTQLTATVTPANATEGTVSWCVDQVRFREGNVTYIRTGKCLTQDLITLDSNGKITALKPGRAHIVASAGLYEAYCWVEIKDASEKPSSQDNNNSNTNNNNDNNSNNNTNTNNDTNNNNNTNDGPIDFSQYVAPAGCVYQFRLYNPNSGEHFYTGSQEEVLNLVNAGWNFEGSGFITPTTGDPIYRLYSAEHGDHFYTTSVTERDALLAEGWTLDGDTGIAFPSATADTGRPMYRLLNPNAYPNGEAGAHHFTMSWEEVQNLEKLGWQYEFIAWYSV